MDRKKRNQEWAIRWAHPTTESQEAVIVLLQELEEAKRVRGWWQKECRKAEQQVKKLKEGIAWIADNTTEAHIHHSAAGLLAGSVEEQRYENEQK